MIYMSSPSLNLKPEYDNVTVAETLRKYGPFSIVRECTKDCVLQAEGFSYPVTKGQHVRLIFLILRLSYRSV